MISHTNTQMAIDRYNVCNKRKIKKSYKLLTQRTVSDVEAVKSLDRVFIMKLQKTQNQMMIQMSILYNFQLQLHGIMWNDDAKNVIGRKHALRGIWNAIADKVQSANGMRSNYLRTRLQKSYQRIKVNVCVVFYSVVKSNKKFITV